MIIILIIIELKSNTIFRGYLSLRLESVYKKNLKFFYFKLKKIIFLDYFDILILKIIFKK